MNTQHLTLSIARDEQGALYLPADQVSALLRRLARIHGTAALAEALEDLADQIDVECIAHRTTTRPEDDR